MSLKGRILIVDDEPRNVKLLGAYLLSEGYEILEAHSGGEALAKAAACPPDVILLDIMMPDLDGFEVTRQLKADATLQHIPVVLITALEGTDNRVRGLEAGADEFLTKPINHTELVARVRALHRMKHMQDELRTRAEVVGQLSNQQVGVGQETLLIIEDDPRTAKQLATVLEHRGYQVVLSASAAEATQIIGQAMPDLILLDIMLPDRSGLDLLDEFKSREHTLDIPVLVLTALSDMETKVRGLERGADDYLVKPVDNSELVARVRACLRRANVHNKLQKNVDHLLSENVTDGLTGARNRHYLDADLGHRFALAKRQPLRAFSVVMVDIDHFKRVNDEMGHLAGDLVLRRVSRALQDTARATDVVARFGGEEFCVVLPESSLPEAAMAAERMRVAIEAQIHDDLGGRKVSASFGVAIWSVNDQALNDVLERADQALYQAKEGGRNRVCQLEEGAAHRA